MLLIFCFATLVLSFDFKEYQVFLKRFGKRNIDRNTSTWYTNRTYLRNTTKANGEHQFFSSVPENCPKPSNGVPLWEAPQNEVYGAFCKWALRTNEKKELLRKAMIPSKQGYPPIRIYHHVTLNVTAFLSRGPGEFIFETQLQKMNKSKLLDHASLEVRIGLLDENINQTLTYCVKEIIKNRIEEFAKGATIKWVWPSMYECGTISQLRLWCFKKKGSFVLYLHNKGISHLSEPEVYSHVQDWREFMMFFLVERWNLCANVLSRGAAACGVGKSEDFYQHFSGNFWWSSCKHVLNVRNPCPIGRNFRHAAEFWLISDTSNLRQQRAVELWEGITNDGYKLEYPRYNYSCVDLLDVNH